MNWKSKRVVAAALFFILCSSAHPIPELPQPPCTAGPFPSYGPVNDAPRVQVWEAGEIASWVPPACVGWRGLSFRSLVALAGRFYQVRGADELRSRIGAVSTLKGVRYWSTMDKSWNVLITDASALDGPNAGQRRPDFSAVEIKAPSDLFFIQADNRASAPVVYRMRIETNSADHIAVNISNLSPVKWHFITLFPTGSLRIRYWMDRLTSEVWGLYLLSGETTQASWLAGGHEASYINRAAALYRHLLGVPTDQNPPLAP